uniref:Uncharacterized protein n=1 Tax=Acrobeloides nanus TaxID=290746 RepID=A0A914DGU2_9BILA
MYINGVDQSFSNTSIQNDKQQTFSFDSEDFLMDNAAVIDRSGVLLYSMITAKILKNVDGCATCANGWTNCDSCLDECAWNNCYELLSPTWCDRCILCQDKKDKCTAQNAQMTQMCSKCEPYVNQIVSLLRNATIEYYNKNKIFGCMDRDAYNFNPNANIDDGTCQTNYTYKNYTIGGVFQKCQIITNNESTDPIQHLCHNYSQINIDTNLVDQDYICAEGFQAMKILDIRMKLPDHININTFHDDVAHIESYVCQPNDGGSGISDIEMGYLFGGFYGKNTTNNVTGDMTCPDHFTKHNLFDIVVCLSRDYRDRRFSVELGGFFSCQTKKEEASCPTGFVQHLATTIEGCDVYVCLGTDASMRLKLPLIKRPPFERNPNAVSNETETIINV